MMIIVISSPKMYGMQYIFGKYLSPEGEQISEEIKS